MEEVFELFLAFLRFVMHSFAAAVGFSLLAAITLIPLNVMRYLVREGDPDVIGTLKLLQTTIFYLDVVLFCLTLLAVAYLFVRSLWIAVRRDVDNRR